MATRWQKLNYLVPGPQCRTKGNQIIEWTDTRAQPTDEAIDAVTDQQAADGLVSPDEQFITDELANPGGNPFEVLKALRRLGKI